MCTLITIMIITIKYLVCVVDEFLDCSSMVEHRVKLGSRALGAWLRQRCETGRSEWQIFCAVDAVSLVESVLLYGTEFGAATASCRG